MKTFLTHDEQYMIANEEQHDNKIGIMGKSLLQLIRILEATQ